MAPGDGLVYCAAMIDEPGHPDGGAGLDGSDSSNSGASGTPLGGAGRLDREISRLSDETRGADAARSRSRAHWLRRQSEEQATLAGVLVDLAERADRVVLTTASGRRHRGWLRSVAADFCVLYAETGQQVVVTFAALTSVRCEPGRPAAGGDRDVVSRLTLADHLAALGDLDTRVSVTTTAPGETLGGVLRSVGRDVLVVGLDGDDRSVVYVPVASVAEVSLPAGSLPVSG